jgi:hypothetical protein
MGDPWTDPLAELERIDQEIHDHYVETQTQELAFAQYDALWKRVISDSRTGSDMSLLGSELRRRGHTFWLDVWLWIMRREHEASRRQKVRQDDMLRAQAISLLIASTEHDGQPMESILNQTYEVVRPFALENPLREAGHYLRLWGDAKDYPHTPHMTRQELVRATRGMRKLSPSSICRAIQKGRMTIDEPKGDMVRFRHLKPHLHLEMLRAVIKALEKP